MKKNSLVLLVLLMSFSAVFAQNDKGSSAIKLNNHIDSVSYAYGIYMASSINGSEFQGLDKELLLIGMNSALLDTSNVILNSQEVISILGLYYKEKKEADIRKLSDPGINWLEDNSKKEGVITTASGLQYKVITEGTGAKPKLTDTIRVKYIGKLIDGTVFDNSSKRDEPAIFPVNIVIKGWKEGLQLMPVGSKYNFYLPYQLAYGEKGERRAKVGPYSTLIFEVELLEINP